MTDLANKVLKGDRLALSRLITLIENDSQDHHVVLDQLFPHTGKAHIIGITGPSGSGKSTLVNRLALNMVSGKNRDSSHKIGIIAVDPTSPFSGGALLGDRVRMRNLTSNSNIFIRSMASRGALGGIARAVDNTALVMDAAGFEIILIETVGAGQSEVEIARLAHTTIVVEAPGLGDDIQGEELRAQSNENSHTDWQVPVIKTSALNGDGISEVTAAVNAHHVFLQDSGEWKIRSTVRLNALLERLVRDSLYDAWNDPPNQKKMEEILRLAADHQRSPYQSVQDLLK